MSKHYNYAIFWNCKMLQAELKVLAGEGYQISNWGHMEAHS